MANIGFRSPLFILGYVSTVFVPPPIPPVVTVISHGWIPPGSRRPELDFTDLMDEMERLRRKRQLRRDEEELVLIQ